MPFREKTAWITLAATLLAYGGYFVRFGRTAAAGRMPDMIWGVSLAVLVYVVIQAVLMIIAAVAAPQEANAPADERDAVIQTDARAGAFHVLQVSGLVAVASVYVLDKWMAANAMFAALVLAELARNLLVIGGYRRSA
jgi:hypothetical protein